MRTQAVDIYLEGVTKSYGAIQAIPHLTARFIAGEFTVILGPSGCGKSTLLMCIAGLESLSSGTIKIGDDFVHRKEPKDRGCAMVFQNYALYPHMSVLENITYNLKIAGLAKNERIVRARKVARIVDLDDYLDRRPGQLSGGQRQRVAIARAIVREPRVLLYDEPLSNLDARLRQDMRQELAQLHKRIGATSLFVTHDQLEAMSLADRIMLLNKGSIEQFDTPENIYNNPASIFVATFIGSPSMNLIEVTGDGKVLRLEDDTILLKDTVCGAVMMGIRPEHIILDPQGSIKLYVQYQEKLGAQTVTSATLPTGQSIMLTTPADQAPVQKVVTALFPAEHIRYFDPTSGVARPAS
ncbi:MAG: ATP-binding cassette domain-containing protein [Pseudomonadota bacterium]